MLTSEQRTARRAYIGSSDAPAILGVDPFRNRHDVFLDKTRDLEDFTSPAIEAGNLLEPVLIDWCSRQLDRPIRNRGTMHVRGDLACNLDADLSDTEIIEAKTTGMVDHWGEENSDEVPDKVLVQTHHAFHCTGAVVAYVPVILARFSLKFALYRVERNDKVCEAVAAECIDFMQNNVRKGIAPVGAPSLDVVKRVRRQPETWCDVPDELVEAWQQHRKARLAAEKIEDEAQAAVLAALGTCDGGRTGLGDLTHLEYSRKGYTVAPSKYRQLKLKGSK